MKQQSISFAGAGNVGGALCREFFQAGFRIDMITTETENSGQLIADLYGAVWSPDLKFPDHTEIIIVAVPDHRLREVLKGIRCSAETLVAHTAGSFGLDIFPEQIHRKGVFYPLQTFSRGRIVSIKDLPFLIEASDDHSASILKSLADSIGGEVHFVNTDQRRKLHLAGVFVNNFTNHMLTEGKHIAEKAGFSFGILEPLLNETISKAMMMGPEYSQTGPAIRNDHNTIKKHLDLLSFSPELRKLYIAVTESIIKSGGKK